MYGRKQIMTSERVFTDGNIVSILNKALTVHEQNARDIQRLYDYYTGKQDILDRVKEVRAEINNKVVVNRALEIANFKIGFTFGKPIQYVYAGTDTVSDSANSSDDESLAKLNRLMRRMGKSAKDTELAFWLFVCGVAQRITLYDKNTKEIETHTCDPRSCFVVYSDDFRHEPLLGVVFSRDDTINGKINRKYSVYSQNRFWEIENGKIKQSQAIAAGIPITEYRANATRQGSFEIVLGLIDAINKSVSNRIDGIEQNIQSLTWFNNIEIDEKQYTELSQKGGICTKSSSNMPASIQMLKNDLDQTQTQVAIDDLYQAMLTIAAVPDRRASAGGNTGQALIIGEGWTNAESAAETFEDIFDADEKRFLTGVLRIVKSVDTVTTTPDMFSNLEIEDIKIQFTRNKTDNLLTKTQGLQNQLEAGVHPRIAIENCGLYSDPHQVYVDSETAGYLDKWKQTGEQDKAATGQNSVNVEEEFNTLLQKIGGAGSGDITD